MRPYLYIAVSTLAGVIGLGYTLNWMGAGAIDHTPDHTTERKLKLVNSASYILPHCYYHKARVSLISGKLKESIRDLSFYVGSAKSIPEIDKTEASSSGVIAEVVRRKAEIQKSKNEIISEYLVFYYLFN
jgi:hypothetical protein